MVYAGAPHTRQCHLGCHEEGIYQDQQWYERNLKNG
jgi:hypothetical protein